MLIIRALKKEFLRQGPGAKSIRPKKLNIADGRTNDVKKVNPNRDPG